MSRDNFKDDFEKSTIDRFKRSIRCVNNETNDEIDNFNNETDHSFHQEMHKDDKEEETNLLVVTKI